MSEFMERAAALRAATDVHYNCAQSVVIPFAAAAGLGEEAARKIAANFGAGMKRAAACGAITGGLMVLGLFGLEDPATVGGYYKRLRDNHQNRLDCSELLQINQQQGGDKKAHCDGMVFECVALVEELLREAGKL